MYQQVNLNEFVNLHKLANCNKEFQGCFNRVIYLYITSVCEGSNCPNIYPRKLGVIKEKLNNAGLTSGAINSAPARTAFALHSPPIRIPIFMQNLIE